MAALETWGERGIPAKPGAWLTRAAQRKVLDRLRRDTTLRRKLPALVEPEAVRPQMRRLQCSTTG